MKTQKNSMVSNDALLSMASRFSRQSDLISSLLREMAQIDSVSDSEQERLRQELIFLGGELMTTYKELVKLDGKSARARILEYLKANVGRVVEGDTLAMVSGISECVSNGVKMTHPTG